MRVARHTDAAIFLSATEDFLMRREAHHSLILSTIHALIRTPARPGSSPYLAAVLRGREVVATAAIRPPDRLEVSLSSDGGALYALAEDLLRVRPTLPGVFGPDPESELFARVWSLLSGQRSRPDPAQILYQLRGPSLIYGARGHLRLAGEADRDLVVAWLTAYAAEGSTREVSTGYVAEIADRHLAAGNLFLWCDGPPVGMAIRTGSTPTSARLSGVYTPPALRRRGYAGACVSSLSRLILDSGRENCYLFADKGNPGLGRLYRRIGYRPVGDFVAFRFEAAGSPPRPVQPR